MVDNVLVKHHTFISVITDEIKIKYSLVIKGENQSRSGNKTNKSEHGVYSESNLGHMQGECSNHYYNHYLASQSGAGRSKDGQH